MVVAGGGGGGCWWVLVGCGVKVVVEGGCQL